jgi:hypothetical protein
MQQGDSRRIFEIPLSWESVLAKGNRFDWHKEQLPAGPDWDKLYGSKIYKWEFRSQHLPAKLYIGQCQEFQERLAKYRAAKKDGSTTEARFQHETQAYEGQGGTVDLYFLDIGTSIVINGKPVNKLTLGELAVRLMLESIAIVSAQVAGFELVNQLGNNWYQEQIFELDLVQNFVRRKGREEAMKLFGFDEQTHDR